MSIIVKKHRITQNFHGKKKTGWYLRAVKQKTIDLKEIAKESTRNTGIPWPVAEAVVNLLLDGVNTELKNGNFVDLDVLGRLSPAVDSRMFEDEADLKTVLSKLIVNINYRPSEELLSALQSAHVELDKSDKKPRHRRTKAEIQQDLERQTAMSENSNDE